jgi:hypothetical protein
MSDRTHTTPAPNGPNGCWQRHGYRVERIGAGYARRIFSPAGELVLDCAGYEGEMAFCRANGLLDGLVLEPAA